MSDTLLARVQAWLDDDTDADTRAELLSLLGAHDLPALQDRFVADLKFGTAGLRGLIGAGPNRMNRTVVARVTAGLCASLSDADPNTRTRGLCIGFDGRRMSRELAEEAAEVALGAGFMVHAFAGVIPTPMLAHAVVQLGAAAGVMITASHNPPAYNGYKAFGENGAQLITPHDEAVARAASRIQHARNLPRLSVTEGERAGLLRCVDAQVATHYHAAIQALVSAFKRARAPLRIAYTALHGVGNQPALQALSLAGFDDVHSVADQAEPDGTFPTVSFPNPEEPSAMAQVLALGDAIRADIVLANDPDADRLAVAARTGDNTIETLSGNEVGLLLTDFLLQQSTDPERTCVLTSIVTTPLVARVARHYGAHWEATLTGTKWICNRAMELETSRGLRCVIGFEEALGYCIGTAVRDKDGIGAAVHVALMAAEAKARGRTLHDLLESLYRQHGLAASRQTSITLTGDDATDRVGRLLQGLTTRPPTNFGDAIVERVIDLSAGLTLPPTPGVILELSQERRVCIRPSGTEPKLKCYLDARVEFGVHEAYANAQQRAQQTLDAMTHALDALLDAH